MPAARAHKGHVRAGKRESGSQSERRYSAGDVRDRLRLKRLRIKNAARSGRTRRVKCEVGFDRAEILEDEDAGGYGSTAAADVVLLVPLLRTEWYGYAIMNLSRRGGETMLRE